MTHNPLELNLRGFVALYNQGPDGLAVGGYSRDTSPIREFAHGDPTVVNIRRAREIAREYHDWDVVPEAELVERAMSGELSG